MQRFGILYILDCQYPYSTNEVRRHKSYNHVYLTDHNGYKTTLCLLYT